jgi:hypothetical protein
VTSFRGGEVCFLHQFMSSRASAMATYS